MGLNIVAYRKLSLADFAQGWGDCYLTIRVANKSERETWLESIEAAKKSNDMAVLSKSVRDICVAVITGGLIMNTDSDGKASPLKIEVTDVPDVLDAVNFDWQMEIIGTSTGANRLKAPTLSA